MKQIKTQNIPVEVQVLTKERPAGLQATELSGEAFKKAIQALIGEGEMETTKPAVEIDLEGLTADEEEQLVEEFPMFFIPTLFPTEQVEINPEPTLEGTVTVEEVPQIVKQESVLVEGAKPEITKSEITKPELAIEQPVVKVIPEIKTEQAIDIPKPTIMTELEKQLPKLEQQAPIEQAKPIVEASLMETLGITKVETKVEPKIQVTPMKAAPQPEPVVMEQTEVVIPEPIPTGPVNEVKLTAEAPDISPKTAESAEVEVVEFETRVANQSDGAVQMVSRQSTRVEAPKVVAENQFVREVETMIVEEMPRMQETENVSTTRIQLTPKHLGEMEIEVVMKENTLTAKLVVEQVETKQWLEQKLTELTKNLSAQNIKVEQFQIEVVPPQTGFAEFSFNDNPFFKQQKESFKQQKQGFYKGQEEEVVPEQVERHVPSSSGRVSLWV